MLAGAEVPLYLNDTFCFKLITGVDVNEKNTKKLAGRGHVRIHTIEGWSVGGA